jgi:hypothetical protein
VVVADHHFPPLHACCSIPAVCWFVGLFFVFCFLFFPTFFKSPNIFVAEEGQEAAPQWSAAVSTF